MKRSILILGLTMSLIGNAQVDITGSWTGPVIVPGAELVMVFNFTQDGDVWAGTYDVPVQMIEGFELTDIAYDQEELSFGLEGVPGDASFKSNYVSSDSIAGTFTQMGQAFQMWFKPYSAADKLAEDQALVEKMVEIEALIDSMRIYHQVPGVGVGIIYGNEIVLNEGYGWRNVAEQLPVTSNTLFAIGSTSKAFTSMLLAQQVDEGNMDWDEPVRTYLPDFELMDEFATLEMTPKDLVIHNSGLPRHDMMWYGTDRTRMEVYAGLRYLEPTESFRSAFQYNNLMFMVAGILAGELYGSSWEQAVDDRIFTPLGMDHTNVSVDVSIESDDHARPYMGDEEIPFRNIDVIGPAGSINSSVDDMLKWVDVQLNQGQSGDLRIVSAEQIKNMHSSHMVMDPGSVMNMGDNYGLGWVVTEEKGKKIVVHGGAIDGFLALVYMVPAEQFGMVILTNSASHGMLKPLSEAVAGSLVFDEQIQWDVLMPGSVVEEEPEEDGEDEITTTPHHPMEAYAGVYEHPGYGQFEVMVEGTGKSQRLMFSYGTFKGELEYSGFEIYTVNVMEDEGFRVNFFTDLNEKVMSVFIELEPMIDPIRFDRLPPNLLEDTDYMAAIQGRYRFEDMDVVVTFDGAKLWGEAEGQGTFELEPVVDDNFRFVDIPGYEMEFLFDKNGKCIGMISHQPNGDFEAEKVD